MMDEKNIERVARAIEPSVRAGGPIYEMKLVDIARAAIIAMTTPPAGAVMFPSTSAGKAALDGNFSPAELRDIADWLEKRLVVAGMR